MAMTPKIVSSVIVSTRMLRDLPALLPKIFMVIILKLSCPAMLALVKPVTGRIYKVMAINKKIARDVIPFIHTRMDLQVPHLRIFMAPTSMKP